MKIKNPVITELRKSADPFVTFYNGAYYSCYTDTHGVYVSKAASLDTLAAAEEHCVFDRCGEWYAPELHKIENNARNMAVLDSRERIADIIVSLAEKN